MLENVGWSLPHSFRSLLDEHAIARKHCAIFDISHSAKFLITGHGVLSWLARVFRARLPICRDGSCVRLPFAKDSSSATDSSICLLRCSAGSFYVMSPAETGHRIGELLRSEPPLSSLEIHDVTEEWCGMVLMGPGAAQVIGSVLAGHELPEPLRFTHFYDQGEELLFGRLSLDGELPEEEAYEFFCPAISGISRYEAFLASGAQPCGYAARAMLRLERLRPRSFPPV